MSWTLLWCIALPGQYQIARIFQNDYTNPQVEVKVNSGSLYPGWFNTNVYIGGFGAFEYYGFDGDINNFLLFPEYSESTGTDEFDFLAFNNFPWRNAPKKLIAHETF